MDPVTALSIASGVVQFIEFSVKIIASCREVVRRGSLTELRITEESVIELREGLEALKRNSAAVSASADLAESNARLKRLGESCCSSAETLLRGIGRLRPGKIAGKMDRGADPNCVFEKLTIMQAKNLSL